MIKTLKIIVGCIAVCSLIVGCASSPAIHRDKDPSYRVSSTLSPNEAAICYSEYLDSHLVSREPVILKPTNTGYTVQRWRYWHTLFIIPVGYRNTVLIDIHTEEQGSNVDIYVEPLFYMSGKKLSNECLGGKKA